MADADFPVEMMPCIEKFFKEVHPSLVSGKDLYPEVFDTELFFPLQRQRELAWMMAQARELSPKVVMEIGADKGSSLYHWCMCLPTVTHVVASEIRGTPYAELFCKVFPHIQFTWIKTSRPNGKACQSVTDYVPYIDCLFIDGDKNAFLDDFDAYLPYMNNHGKIFMHDINEEYNRVGSPRWAFEQVRQRGFHCKEYIDTTDTMEAIDRQSKGIPPKSSHEGWLTWWAGRSCGVGMINIQ